MKKRPVVCWATIDWHFLFQRPQHLMLGLARAGHPVYFRDVTQVPQIPLKEVERNLWVAKDFGQIPSSVLETAVHFVYHPGFASQIEAGGNMFIVYDLADDFPEFEESHALMFSKAHLVLCTSQTIFQKHGTRHPHVVLLPNAADPEHFVHSHQRPPQELKRLKKTGHVVLGFASALYPGWVDVELLYYLSSINPRWQVVVVGERYWLSFKDAPPNLHYLGRHHYQVLPAILKSFDVGLIPFLDNQIARGSNPIKLYEYLASGLPVVSRDLPFAQGLKPPLLYTYTTREECAEAISKALRDQAAMGNTARRLRQRYANGR